MCSSGPLIGDAVSAPRCRLLSPTLPLLWQWFQKKDNPNNALAFSSLAGFSQRRSG